MLLYTRAGQAASLSVAHTSAQPSDQPVLDAQPVKHVISVPVAPPEHRFNGAGVLAQIGRDPSIRTGARAEPCVPMGVEVSVG